MAPARRVELDLLRVAERRGRLIWSLLPVLSPGKTALLLAPPAPHSAPDLVASADLLELLCKELHGRGFHLAQALLSPDDADTQRLFLSRRFEPMAELIYLSGEPRRRFVTPAVPDGLAWLPYTDELRELFKDAIGATYEQSLDCPGLNGVRDMEDVLAGHQASGEFDPKLWRLLVRPPAEKGHLPTPVAVLLLSRVPQVSSVELVYLGVVPSARGKRLGDLLVRQALAAVIEQNADRLTLAVDAKNAPALKTYYRNGLTRTGMKRAVMRDLRADDVPPRLSTGETPTATFAPVTTTNSPAAPVTGSTVTETDNSSTASDRGKGQP